MRFTILFVLLTHGVFAQKTNILMQHGDLSKTGWNNQERILNTKYVNANSFGKLFTVPVDDQLYAQPLVLSNVNISGAIHTVLIAATVNNTVYAFDAETGKSFWTKNYTPDGLRPPLNTDLTGACGGNYNDFSGKMGIVGTPVIDSVSNTMYFVSRSLNSNGAFFQYLHAVDILNNGAERNGSPVLIQASVSGNGAGAVAGLISFDPKRQNQRGGLFMAKGIVYIPYASHCDWGPYHGWILGYDALNLKQKIVYNTTPEGFNGGIWMSGAAPAVDENGNIYAAVGNGAAGLGGVISDLANRAESAIQLAPEGNTLKVKTFFTPSNYQALENADLDFGVTQMLLVPGTNLVITGCKDGTIYVLNRNTMGGFNAGSNQVWQSISLGSSKTLRSSLAYYKGPEKSFFYTWSENAALKAFPFNTVTGKFDESKVIIGTAQGPNGSNGSLLTVSSDGNKPGTAILWASHAASGDAIHEVRPGILRAFDANDVTKELWNSNMNPADNLGKYAKFVCPTVANGKVYMATFSKQLTVYGLGDTSKTMTCQSTNNVALNKAAVASSVQSEKFPPSAAFDNSKTTRWASAKGIDPQWIYVDLNAYYKICTINLLWEAAFAKNYKIQVSDDAKTWTTIFSKSENTSTTNSISVNGKGRFVRMYGTARATAHGYSLYDFQVYGVLSKNCDPPSNLTVANRTRTSAAPSWSSVAGATEYIVSYKSLEALNYSKVSSTQPSFKIKNLSCGHDYLWQVQAKCNSATLSDASETKAFSTLGCDPNCGFLPTRWMSQEIGNLKNVGEACYNKNVFTLQAGGGHIGGTSDAFRFAGTTFSGNGNITARIDFVSPDKKGAQSGIMFRDSLDPGARNAALLLDGNGKAFFQYRKENNKTTSKVVPQNIHPPYWVKLIKRKTVYSAYLSRDSLEWTQIGKNIDLGFGQGTILSGLVVSGPDSAKASTAIISHVPIFFTSDTTVKRVCAPVFSIASIPIEICRDEKAKIRIQSKNTRFTWTPSDGISSLNDSVFYASPTVTTSYTVTGHLADCPHTISKTILISVKDNPIINTMPLSKTICQGEIVTLSAFGNAGTYFWEQDNSLNTDSGSTVFAQPDSTTIYTVTGTNDNGCTTEATSTITVTPPCATTVWFKKQADMPTPMIHYWNTIPGNAQSQWPGLVMNADSAKGPDWFTFTIQNAQSTSLLFHDGFDYQTEDMTGISGGCFDGSSNTWVPCDSLLTDRKGVGNPSRINTGLVSENNKLEGQEILFDLLPNPAAENTILYFQKLTEKNMDLKVVDCIGKEVFKENLVTPLGNYQKTLQLDQFQKGIYTIVVNDGRRISYKKLVVQ